MTGKISVTYRAVLPRTFRGMDTDNVAVRKTMYSQALRNGYAFEDSVQVTDPEPDTDAITVTITVDGVVLQYNKSSSHGALLLSGFLGYNTSLDATLKQVCHENDDHALVFSGAIADPIERCVYRSATIQFWPNIPPQAQPLKVGDSVKTSLCSQSSDWSSAAIAERFAGRWGVIVKESNSHGQVFCVEYDEPKGGVKYGWFESEELTKTEAAPDPEGVKRRHNEALAIAFSQGAKWWHWLKTGGTMWTGDNTTIDKEAQLRLGRGVLGVHVEDRTSATVEA